MDPPLAPAKAKKLLDTIPVAKLPSRKLDLGRANDSSTSETTAKQSVPKGDARETNDEDTPDPPKTAPTEARKQLRKAIEMLKTQRPVGENLTIKNAVLAALEDLAGMLNQQRELPAPHQDSTEDRRITTVENDMKEIKETMREMKAMLAANKPLWSTVAASPPTNAGGALALAQLEAAKRERLELARQERAKTSVTLTFHNANETEYKALKDTSESEYTAILQRAINESNAKNVTIRKLQKLSGKFLKIECHSEDDAKQLREIEWEKTIAGVTLASREYGVVLHGVPIDILDARTTPQQDMKELIQQSNNIRVKRIAPLTRKPRNPSAPTQSIVIFTNSPNEANKAIEDGLRIERKNEETQEMEGNDYEPRRYYPQYQIKQCFRCQAYGHKAEDCKRTMVCGRCTQEHESRTCTAEVNKCTHCGDAHPAWHRECPRRLKEHEKLGTLIATAPSKFPC